MTKRKYHRSTRSDVISKRLKTIIWDDRIGLDVGSIECPCCGHNQITQSDFHCGHIKPESLGGSTRRNNLFPVCCQCNLSMATRNMRDFMFDQFNRKLNDIIKEYLDYKEHVSKMVKVFKPGKCKNILKRDIQIVIDTF